MEKVKKNVGQFDLDVKNNDGYIYTTNNKFSSIVASKRITDSMNQFIEEDVKTLIDIGCGDGTHVDSIKKFRPDLNITGVEPAANAIDIAKSKYKNIVFEVASIYDDEYFKGKHFDLAIFRGVLHHVSDPELAIKKITGFADKMLIVEPNGNNFILKIIERYSKYHIEHEEQSFSSSTLKIWCENSGWNIKALTFIGFVPIFFPTIPSKIIYFFQPLLEKLPVINKYLSGQIVILCEKRDKKK